MSLCPSRPVAIKNVRLWLFRQLTSQHATLPRPPPHHDLQIGTDYLPPLLLLFAD